MKAKDVIRVVSSRNITSPVEALNAGLPLKLLGTGAYRKVFEVVGAGLVIKFPNPSYLQLSECILHSVKEYKAITKVMTSKSNKYAHIKKHMPRVHYCNTTTGVLIVRKYELLASAKVAVRGALSLKLRNALNGKTLDVNNCGNVGIDGRGTLKVIDAGYLLGI